MVRRVCTVEVIALQLLACGLFWQVALTQSGSRDAWVVTGMLLGLSAFRAVSWLLARRMRAWGSMKGNWEGTLWRTAHVHARRVLHVVDWSATGAATACLIVSLLLMPDPVWFWVIPLIWSATFAGDAVALNFVAGDLVGASRPAHPENGAPS